MNVDVTKLSYEQLQAEYELSQWALACALHKLGGRMEVTGADMKEMSPQYRIWYSKHGAYGVAIVVELKEWKPDDNPASDI